MKEISIDSTVLQWLLEDDNPAVKYRTTTELLGIPKDSNEAKELHNALMRSDLVADTLKLFDENKLSKDCDAFSALAELGLTRKDVSIDKHAERIIANTDFKLGCGGGLILRNLVALGYYEKVEEEIKSAFEARNTDGGFNCSSKNKKINDPKVPHKSCYKYTKTYLLLAAELHKIGIIIPDIDSFINYFLSRDVLFRHDNPEQAVVSTSTFFPLVATRLGMQMVLYSLAVLNVVDKPQCERAFALLESKKDSNGSYPLEDSLTKPYLKVGKCGKPNKWVTLYALLAKKGR